jgi:hypothetical protein
MSKTEQIAGCAGAMLLSAGYGPPFNRMSKEFSPHKRFFKSTFETKEFL